MLSIYTALLTLLPLALAKTDLSGCTSSETVAYGGASLIWYVPGTGEICEFLDCGGGRAPPITTQPGCPQYSGTASYTPSYLPGYGSGGASTTVAVSTGEHGNSGSGSRTTTALPESTGSSTATGSMSSAPVVTSAPLSTGIGTKSTVSTVASSANATVATPSASATSFSSNADIFSTRAVGKELVAALAAVVGVIALL